jgi:hypothetical protein
LIAQLQVAASPRRKSSTFSNGVTRAANALTVII